MGNNLAFDETMEKIREERVKDFKIVDDFLANGVLESFMTELSSTDNDFKIKHAYLSCAKIISYISQIMFDEEDEYIEALKRAENVTVDRIIPSITPMIDNGKIVEKDYDIKNLSLVNLMLSTSSLIDYTFWKADLNIYSELRHNAEIAEKTIKA